MFRRVGRPGLIGTVARTAVVAGTATATANAVGKHQAKKAAEKQAAADQQAPDQAPPPEQPYPQQPQQPYQAPPQQPYQAPQQPYPPQQAYQAPPAADPAPAGGDDDLVAQLSRLAQLRDSGVLSDAEFAAAKGKLLGL